MLSFRRRSKKFIVEYNLKRNSNDLIWSIYLTSFCYTGAASIHSGISFISWIQFASCYWLWYSHCITHNSFFFSPFCYELFVLDNVKFLKFTLFRMSDDFSVNNKTSPCSMRFSSSWKMYTEMNETPPEHYGLAVCVYFKFALLSVKRI